MLKAMKGTRLVIVFDSRIKLYILTVLNVFFYQRSQRFAG